MTMLKSERFSLIATLERLMKSFDLASNRGVTETLTYAGHRPPYVSTKITILRRAVSPSCWAHQAELHSATANNSLKTSKIVLGLSLEEDRKIGGG